MNIGLTKEKLAKLSSFGNTKEEILHNVFGYPEDEDGLLDRMGGALQRKMVELITKTMNASPNN